MVKEAIEDILRYEKWIDDEYLFIIEVEVEGYSDSGRCYGRNDDCYELEGEVEAMILSVTLHKGPDSEPILFFSPENFDTDLADEALKWAAERAFK